MRGKQGKYSPLNFSANSIVSNNNCGLLEFPGPCIGPTSLRNKLVQTIEAVVALRAYLINSQFKFILFLK